MSFRHSRIKLGPKWLVSEGESNLVTFSLATMADAYAERARQALLVRFPQQDPSGTPAPPTALAAIGRDRRVVRGINESAASYARRLKQWLTDRQTSGNPFTLMQKVAEYVGDGIVKVRTVDARGNWFTRDVDGTRSFQLNEGNWDWDDTSASSWSRFWVIIYPNGVWTKTPEYGVAHQWGDVDITWGSTATRDQVSTLRFIVDDWKPQGTRCVHIILAFDGNSFDPTAPEPDGLWGQPGKTVNGVRVSSRLSTALYLDGTA